MRLVKHGFSQSPLFPLFNNSALFLQQAVNNSHVSVLHTPCFCPTDVLLLLLLWNSWTTQEHVIKLLRRNFNGGLCMSAGASKDVAIANRTRLYELTKCFQGMAKELAKRKTSTTFDGTRCLPQQVILVSSILYACSCVAFCGNKSTTACPHEQTEDKLRIIWNLP